MTGFKQRIADILLAQEMASKDELNKLMAESARGDKHFARLLIERGVVSEAALTELLSKELGLPMISVLKYRMDPAVSQLIPERLSEYTFPERRILFRVAVFEMR